MTDRSQGPRTPEPAEQLRVLDPLVGLYRLESRDLTSGETSLGEVERRWAPGGFFMTQRTTAEAEAGPAGTEYIGYDSELGAIRSMLFSDQGPGPFCSFALEYVWELDAARLTIWHGWRDSPARFDGTIEDRGALVSGRWEWPGGGYEAIATRIGG